MKFAPKYKRLSQIRTTIAEIHTFY